MNPARKRAFIELLIVAVIWGVAAPIIKYTLEGFSPVIFLTYRFFISTVIALIIFAATGIKFPKNPKVLWVTLLNGFLISTVSLGLLFLGTAKTTSINSNIISAMTPVMIAIAAVFFLKERIGKRESIGILIALAGTLITVVEPLYTSSAGFGQLTGNLLVFAAVIITTVTAVLAKIILRDNVDALFATNISFVIGFITILPIALINHSPTNILNTIYSAPLGYHLGVFYMAVVSGTLGYFLWHKAEKTIEISKVNLITYLYPIFGTPLSVFWLKEKITPLFIIGAAVMASGVFLAEWKKRRYNSP
jgi:drug/metabolite transporter (DMT)-like permease